LLRIEETSGGSLLIEQGALYLALYRLETQSLLGSEWGISENNRHARFYTLTPAGRKRLKEEVSHWNQLTKGMALALGAGA
jgi:DNA-binding PadR family transcriptional regulator